MGKPDGFDRVAQALIALVGVFALIFGIFMLIHPYEWYQLLPTVKFTGPPNQHFIRDIGLGYAASGVMLCYAAINPPMRWLAALAGSLWLIVHGILHIYEVLTGICSVNTFWQDAPAVLGLPLLVWIAVGILFARQRISPAGVPKSALLSVFDRMSPDESAYFHEVAQAPGHAFEKLAHFMPVTMHRWEASADMFHMARIGATLIEDCGPCAMTAAQGALGDGVDRALINAALAAAPPEGDLKTAFAFGQAIATQSAEALALGDAIEASHGRTVRLELAMTAATVRAYPAMKRGLGLGKSCSITKLEV
jgi:hypothetical protein